MALLGDLVEITGGGTPSRKNEAYWGGDVYWATVKDFKGLNLNSALEKITPEGLENSASNFIQAGSIIVPTRMAVGKAAINTVGMAINQDLKALQIKDNEIVDRDYLFRVLLSQSAYLESRGKGATVKGITLDVLRELEIPLPPLKEQKRIAAILDKADAIRRKRQQAIDLTDQLLRAVFLDMFGDPVTNPKGWGVQLFEDIVDNYDSMRVPLKQADRDLRHGDYPYYGSVGIIDCMDDYIYEGDYLLISEDGKHLESRTRPIACIATGKFWVNNHAHVVKCNDKSDLMFLSYFMEMIPIRKYITGIDQIKLNRKSLDRIPVPVPPIELQLKFKEFANKINKQKSGMSEAVEDVGNLFGSLTQQAFNGKLSQATQTP